MIFSGIPNLLKMWSLISLAVPSDVSSVVVGAMTTILVRRQTATKIMLYVGSVSRGPFDSGNGPMRSIEMIWKGFVGTSFGLSSALRGPCRGLVCWHFSHALTYLL